MCEQSKLKRSKTTLHQAQYIDHRRLVLGSQWVQKYIAIAYLERLSVKMKCAIQHRNSTHPYGSDFPGCQVQTIQLRYSENDKQ